MSKSCSDNFIQIWGQRSYLIEPGSFARFALLPLVSISIWIIMYSKNIHTYLRAIWYSFPTINMCNKFAPYLHQKSSNYTLNMVLFWWFEADVSFLIRPKQHHLKVQFRQQLMLNLHQNFNFLLRYIPSKKSGTNKVPDIRRGWH